MEEDKLLTTKEAIENRRSIRKFKTDPVSDDIILALLESAKSNLSVVCYLVILPIYPARKS